MILKMNDGTTITLEEYHQRFKQTVFDRCRELVGRYGNDAAKVIWEIDANPVELLALLTAAMGELIGANPTALAGIEAQLKALAEAVQDTFSQAQAYPDGSPRQLELLERHDHLNMLLLSLTS